MDDLADFEPRRWFRKVEPVEKKRMRKKRKMDWLRSAPWMRRTRNRFRFLSLLISRRAGKKRAQSCASVAERPSMRQPLPCLPGYLTSTALKARVAESETISAGNIVSLEAAKAKLVCLSFLGIGSSSAQVRYLVRRLRRILPSGSIILVGCWTDDAAGAPVKALKETAEADAYATSFHEAAEIAVNAARRPGLELVTPLQPGAAAHGTSNLMEVFSSREVPLKIVPQPPDGQSSSSQESKKSYWERGRVGALSAGLWQANKRQSGSAPYESLRS